MIKITNTKRNDTLAKLVEHLYFSYRVLKRDRSEALFKRNVMNDIRNREKTGQLNEWESFESVIGAEIGYKHHRHYFAGSRVEFLKALKDLKEFIDTGVAPESSSELS